MEYVWPCDLQAKRTFLNKIVESFSFGSVFETKMVVWKVENPRFQITGMGCIFNNSRFNGQTVIFPNA